MLARQLPVIMVLELALELAQEPELTLGHQEQELTMIMNMKVDL